MSATNAVGINPNGTPKQKLNPKYSTVKIADPY